MVKVTFTNKAGKVESITLPTLAFAEGHVKRVGGKNATFVDLGVASHTVVVTKVATADAETVRQAAKAYYKSVNHGVYMPTFPATVDTAEQDAERMAEHFADCRAAGMAMEDAFADWDHIQSR